VTIRTTAYIVQHGPDYQAVCLDPSHEAFRSKYAKTSREAVEILGAHLHNVHGGTRFRKVNHG